MEMRDEYDFSKGISGKHHADEETHLNRVGAEIIKGKVYLGVDNRYWLRGPGDYALGEFDCVHDLNHTKLVEDAMVEKGFHFMIDLMPDNKEYRIHCFKTGVIDIQLKAPLKDEAICKMRAIFKAVEGE